MAESATLNAGQCHPKKWKSIKSTTNPRFKRSIRLPMAPPIIKEKGKAKIALSNFLIHMNKTTTMPIVNILINQPTSYRENKPKLIPLF